MGTQMQLLATKFEQLEQKHANALEQTKADVEAWAEVSQLVPEEIDPVSYF